MVGIKGMAMPEDCYDCPAANKVYIDRGPMVCPFAERMCPYTAYQRPYWCPLVEIKEDREEKKTPEG